MRPRAAFIGVLLASAFAADAAAVAEEQGPATAKLSNPVAAQSLDQL